MSNFEKAAALSLQDWVDTLPKETEKYKHTPEYEKAIQKLFDKMRRNKFHKLTRKTARAILIAAILLLIATVALASTVGKDFVIKHFGSYATYEVVNNEKGEKVDGINIGYIPEGFEQTDYQQLKSVIYIIYEKDVMHFNVYKTVLNSVESFNADKTTEEVINLDGFEYLYYDNQNDRGIVWNNSRYSYRITGNISKTELLRIAKSTS